MIIMAMIMIIMIFQCFSSKNPVQSLTETEPFSPPILLIGLPLLLTQTKTTRYP